MSRESKAERYRRMHDEYSILCSIYKNPASALVFRNPFELLIATMMSAQTTDVQVNKVTPELFSRYPTPESLADAPVQDVEQIIRTIGFYHTKAQRAIIIANELVQRFNSEVPHTMEELTTLPGVGRKTANVVLGNAFNLPGFPVDTHVIRVTKRLHWRSDWRSAKSDPVRIEKEVTAAFPPQEWKDLSHRLINFGRDTCHARKPECLICPLRETCPSFGLYI
ncbi:endonuclease III [Scardovia wiggsiae]|nr:endonuclease III [Scardovia wiggsiae]